MRLLIVGGGAGGMSAAAQARRIDPNLEITVLEQTEHVSVGRCGLPYFIGDRVRDARSLVVRTPDYFRRERRIDVRTHHRVEAIYPGQRTVTGRDLLSGSPFELRYDRLVLGTGASPAPLGVEGATLPHVFTVRGLDEAIRLKAALEQRTARSAAVIGGGYIGLELAEALHRWNLRVTVIESAGRLLTPFDPWVSDLVANELAAHGVRVLTSHTVLGVEPGAVQTRESGPVPADLVVVAVGSRPEVGLVRGAELGRSGALAVGRQMQTSLPAIWAAGDCAESRSAVTGRATHVPLGSVANLHGRVAGEAAAGRRIEAPPLAGTFLLQLFDLALARAGLSEAEAPAHGFTPVAAEVTGPVRAPIFGGHEEIRVRLVADARTGRLLGGQMAGHAEAIRRIDTVAALLVGAATVQGAAGLDLGYTPPLGTARDPLVLAAQQIVSTLEQRRRW
ncbi:MAG: FAD-dependent oxidoreductase [Bacillota bacterium]